MAQWVEFEGKNVDKAIEKASRELNIEAKELKHTIISFGSSGIFGLAGARKARIRVTIPEQDPVPEETGDADPDVDTDLGGIRAKAISLVDEAFGPINEDHDDTGLSQDTIQLGNQVLQRICDAITSDTDIKATAEDERIIYRVSGGNAGMLIGKRGQTLEAIESIVDKIVNRQSDRKIRVRVDIEGYVEKRKENLRNLASKLAEKCKRTGKPVAVGQMNAQDRRIIHLALKDDRDVRTQSSGDGPMRKIVILPRKGNGKYGRHQRPAARR